MPIPVQLPTPTGSWVPQPASGLSSRNGVFGSTSASIRSRTSILPRVRWRSTYRWPPMVGTDAISRRRRPTAPASRRGCPGSRPTSCRVDSGSRFRWSRRSPHVERGPSAPSRIPPGPIGYTRTMDVTEVLDDLIAEQQSLDDIVSATRAGSSGNSRRRARGGPWPTRSGTWRYFDGNAALAIVDPDAFQDEMSALLSSGGSGDDMTLGRYRAMSPDELLAAWRVEPGHAARRRRRRRSPTTPGSPGTARRWARSRS